MCNKSPTTSFFTNIQWNRYLSKLKNSIFQKNGIKMFKRRIAWKILTGIRDISSIVRCFLLLSYRIGQNNRDLRFCFSINYLRRRRQRWFEPRLEVRGKFKKGIEPCTPLLFPLCSSYSSTTTQPQHCLLPDKELNCNYQSLFLLRIHSPLFDTFLPSLPSSFRLFFLGSLAHFLSPYRSATWKFHPPVIISPPPPLPHNRGHRLRRSKESTWRDEGRRNISLRSEFRETLLFDLMNEKCHCWKKKRKKKERKNDEHNAEYKYKFRGTRESRFFFFFQFKNLYRRKRKREMERGGERK